VSGIGPSSGGYPVTPPCQNLYIYYLKGRLASEREFDTRSFIGNWEEDGFSFLFFSAPCLAAIECMVAGQPQLTLLDHFQMPFEQWQGGPLKPMRIGRFTVTPPWCLAHQPPIAETILLDPGVVFGSGTHPTTQDCLRALEMAFERDPSASTLDLGTGTGLLAIAAARLGSPRVLAVDLNFLAARTAAKNVKLNHLEQRILVAQADAEKCMDLPSDLMVSNIHAEVMKQLINSKGFLNKKQFILSGLLRSQARAVTEQLQRLPVEILSHWERDGIWHTYYGQTV
jgi:ribosomal protein L11 methyltransferase